MSNTPSKRAAAPQRPAERPIVHVPDPASLSFGQMWRIKAATGVDVLDPPTKGHAIAACLWLAGRDLEPALTWEDCLDYDLDHVELEQLDEDLDRDPESGEIDEEETGPTDGSGTPSNG